ncbi:MAG: hypothetical protein COZ57_25045, partial [Armatimonadetes bacterium CG_4_8_14_3_um_filter_66_20]
MTRIHPVRPISLLLSLVACSFACPQQDLVRIVSPKDGDAIVGKVQVEVERKNEAQSYLMYKLAGKWATAQSSNHFEFDSRQYQDGDLKLTVDYHDATGKKAASQEVTLKVSNKVAPEDAGIHQEGLVFRHFTGKDVNSAKVRRYLLTASARADAITIEEESGRPAEDDDGSAAADAAGRLDIDIALLLRQEVKEMHADGSAVVKTIVQSGSERVREGGQAAGGGGMGGGMGMG